MRLFRKPTALEILNEELKRLHKEMAAYGYETVCNSVGKECYIKVVNQIEVVNKALIELANKEAGV